MAAQTAYQSLQESKESESANLQEMFMSLAKEFEVHLQVLYCAVSIILCVCIYTIMSLMTSMYHPCLSFLNGS